MEWGSLLVAATFDAAPALGAGLPIPPLLRLCGEVSARATCQSPPLTATA